MTEVEPDTKGLKGGWLSMVIIILIILIVLVMAAVLVKGKGERPASAPPADATRNAEGSATGDIAPKNAENPEDFLAKIKEKSDEIKKNYDSSLVEFAGKRWQKFFLEQNGLGGDLSNDLKIENREITKEEDGSTVFKINYRYKENPYSDFFCLMLSEARLRSLGSADLAANRFLSEPEIKKHLDQPDFARISRIR